MKVTQIFQQVLVIGVCTAFLKVSVVGILRVSFMCQPAGLWDAQMAGHTLLPGASARVFLEETSMGFSNQGDICPLHVVGPVQSGEGPIEQKG